MKTKFTPLVVFRKQAITKVEQEIASLNMEINKTLEKISAIENEINNTQIPTKGTFYQITYTKDMVHRHRRELKSVKVVLMQLREDKVSLQKKLQNANIEYEKAKHLDDVEKAKYIKEQKRLENVYIDEIAMMLHNNKQRR